MINAIKYLFGAVGRFLTTQWAQYTPFGQFLFVLALIAIAVDAAIAYEYGISMTWLHGMGFALVAITFAILPDVASMEWSKGKKTSAFWIAVACIPIGAVAYQSHIGYGAGVRMGDIQQATVQNARYDDGRENVEDLKRRIAFFEDRSKQLDAEMDKLVNQRVGGWAIQFRPAAPDALDGLIAAKTLERDNEAKRGGCGPICEQRTNELAHLQALKAIAVKIARNNDQHTAVLNGLAKARSEAADIQYDSSTVVNQNGVFAKLFKVAMGSAPEEAIVADRVTAEFVNIMVAGSGALAFMILAPLLMFSAGRNRRPDFLAQWTNPDFDPEPPPAARMTPPAAPAPAPVRHAIAVPQGSLAAVQARREAIAQKVIAMRQSRIDGGLITKAA